MLFRSLYGEDRAGGEGSWILAGIRRHAERFSGRVKELEAESKKERGRTLDFDLVPCVQPRGSFTGLRDVKAGVGVFPLPHRLS